MSCIPYFVKPGKKNLATVKEGFILSFSSLKISSILVSIGVSIPACHAGDPGSIPGLGDHFFSFHVCKFDLELLNMWLLLSAQKHIHYLSIVGSVVECSPATRAARVRFPDDAVELFNVPKTKTYLKIMLNGS
jgi:hypothetical protein